MKRVIIFLLALLPAGAVAQGSKKSPKEISRATMPAVVQIISANFVDEELVPVASGSGTIITEGGAVLTNHHVVWDKDGGKPFDVAAIALLEAYDAPPKIACLAAPRNGVLDAELDLALLKCEVDVQGKAFKPSGWPTVPIATSADELIPGSAVYIYGYPGVGGPTINMTSGHVSGFLGKEGGAGKFWIKTDAAIAHGNSGGTAVDEDGQLVGIPTAVRPGNADTGERVGLLRPVGLAGKLIGMAQDGWEPGGTTSTVPTQDPGECTEKTGVTVGGKVVASDNGKPVATAFVVVLQPGLKRADVAADYSDLASKMITYAVSDADGRWTAPCPIPRDKSFTVIVVAPAFVELYGDDVLSTAGAPDRFEPWGGIIRLQRL